jgi:hypothetical protein
MSKRQVIAVDGHLCWHYNPKNPMEKINCPNCKHWGWTKCKDEDLLMDGFRETENLMRHDAFTRGSGGIRQTRR